MPVPTISPSPCTACTSSRANRAPGSNTGNYEEWGASASVRIDPGADGRGLSLMLAPAWGNTASGTERLWGARHAGLLAPGGAFEATSRLAAEIGYGLEAPHGLGTVTPFAAGACRRGVANVARGPAVADRPEREPRPRRHAQHDGARSGARARGDAARDGALVR